MYFLFELFTGKAYKGSAISVINVENLLIQVSIVLYSLLFRAETTLLKTGSWLIIRRRNSSLMDR